MIFPLNYYVPKIYQQKQFPTNLAWDQEYISSGFQEIAKVVVNGCLEDIYSVFSADLKEVRLRAEGFPKVVIKYEYEKN